MARASNRTIAYRTIVIALGLTALLITGLIMGPAKANARQTHTEPAAATKARVRAPRAASGRAADAPTAGHPAMTLAKLVFARRIAARQPVEPGQRFAADGGQIYAHVEISNPGEPRSVTMAWARDGRVRHRYTVRVGKSRRWRTWSRIGASRHFKGTWELTVSDAEGRALGSGKVTIE